MECWIGMSAAQNASVHVGRPQEVMERTQPDHGIGIDLRNAREKTATGSLTNTQRSSTRTREGMTGMARELAPMSTMLAEFP